MDRSKNSLIFLHQRNSTITLKLVPVFGKSMSSFCSLDRSCDENVTQVFIYQSCRQYDQKKKKITKQFLMKRQILSSKYSMVGPVSQCIASKAQQFCDWMLCFPSLFPCPVIANGVLCIQDCSFCLLQSGQCGQGARHAARKQMDPGLAPHGLTSSSKTYELRTRLVILTIPFPFTKPIHP